MRQESIVTPKLYAIRHKPSGKLLRQFAKGYGHTQLDVEDPINHRRLKEGVHLAPRLFTDKEFAKRALLQWLQGVHRHYWEDGLQVSTPSVPRIKEDMEVIEVELVTHYSP